MPQNLHRIFTSVLAPERQSRNRVELSRDHLTFKTVATVPSAPAIFNWALEGLDRLNERGYFDSPQSGKDAIQQLEAGQVEAAALSLDGAIGGEQAIARMAGQVTRLEKQLTGLAKRTAKRERQMEFSFP